MVFFQKFTKRTFDIVVSFIGNIMLILPCIIISLFVKLTSKGPIFFTQKRVGREGKRFICIKFRTMYIDSEKYGSVTTTTDSRITPVGKIMRKFKLDELPQLWNVLLGNMSLVGPRPDVPGYADKLSGSDRKILELQPGITGPASLCYRNEEKILAECQTPQKFNDEVIWPHKVRINLLYLNDYSFVKDIQYILLTFIPQLNRYFKLVEKPLEK